MSETELNTEFNLHFNLCYNAKKTFLKVNDNMLKTDPHVLHTSGIWDLWLYSSHYQCRDNLQCNSIGMMVRCVGGRRRAVSFYTAWKSSITRSVRSHRCLKCYIDFKFALDACPEWQSHTHTNLTLWMSLATRTWNGKSKICLEFTIPWLVEAMDEHFSNFDYLSTDR